MSSVAYEFSISWGLTFVITVIIAIAADTISNVHGRKVDLERLRELEDTNKALVLQLQQLKEECNVKTSVDK